MSQWVDEVGESKSVDCITNGKTAQHEFLPTTRGPAVQELDASAGCSNRGISWRGLKASVASAQATGNASRECPLKVDTDSESC